MNATTLPKTVLREKVLNSIEKYLSLSQQQSISVGLYLKGKHYILNFNNNEAEMRYDIGSISKTITAHLILKLSQEGLIDLTNSVSHYLTLKEGNYPTVYQLLTHTAGYGHLTPAEITVPHLLMHRYARRNLYENISRLTVLQALERRNKVKDKYSYGYSDFSFAILALVAESVTNTPFHDLLENFLHENLHMNNTFIVRDVFSPKAVLGKKEIEYWHWEKDNPYIAGGGLVSSVDDMLQYIGQEIESNEKYITDAHEICPHSFRLNSNIGTCIGWHTYKRSNQHWHVGGVGTFRSSVIFNKHRKIGVVVLGNTKGKNSANVHYITKMLYSELKMKRIKPEKV